jgi:hypothetical protein
MAVRCPRIAKVGRMAVNMAAILGSHFLQMLDPLEMLDFGVWLPRRTERPSTLSPACTGSLEGFVYR